MKIALGNKRDCTVPIQHIIDVCIDSYNDNRDTTEIVEKKFLWFTVKDLVVHTKQVRMWKVIVTYGVANSTFTYTERFSSEEEATAEYERIANVL